MKHSPTLVVIIFLSLLLSGCGGSQPAASGPTPTSALAATPLSTHVFQQPTTIIKVAAEETNTPEPTAENVDLSRGERVYTNRECGSCHGAAGEGVEGKGVKLAGTSLTEAEFTDLLRTGGEIGNSHLYGPQAISPSGMEALYAYIKSFQP